MSRAGASATTPRFFTTPAEWGAWLACHHAVAKELWVGFHRTTSGRPSITWPESVDEALCFGWIDGVRRSLDATRYVIRFTPRRPGSHWSNINTRRFAELEAAGRVRDAGRRAFAARRPERTGRASYEQGEPATLPPEFAKALRANRAAWRWFGAQAPWYRRTATFWVVSAKREETRARRFATLLACSAEGRTIPPLTRTPKR